MTIPDPKNYIDPILYMLDMHKAILERCSALERLLTTAVGVGLFQSFADHSEWNDLFGFFTKQAFNHEQDEEDLLFPLLESRMPKMGFRRPDTPIRFLVEGHDALRHKTMRLVTVWKVFRENARDVGSLKRSAEEHSKDDQAFVSAGRELVELYRLHIAIEEERVYTLTRTQLERSDLESVLNDLRNKYDNSAITAPLLFDPPQYSDPGYNFQYVSTDAVGEQLDDSESEEEDE